MMMKIIINIIIHNIIIIIIIIHIIMTSLPSDCSVLSKCLSTFYKQLWDDKMKIYLNGSIHWASSYEST